MPAAAVIPAPIAYIKVVAVKTLVVGFLPGTTGPPKWRAPAQFLASSWGTIPCLIARIGIQDFYFEEIRVFTASKCFEYISME